MKFPRRRFLHLAAGAAALPAVSQIAWAQAYPSRPVTMVVPFPAGGGSDVFGRIIAERMSVSLGRPVIIENAGGANGSIGVVRVARAVPDGYTVSLGHWGTHVANGAVYPLTYNVLNDFAPITLLATQPYLIVAKKAMPANDLKEFIAWLQANPGKASQGTPGVGSPGHLGGVLFQKATSTHFQHVPYRGSAPAFQDLVAGQIDFMMPVPADALPQLRLGNIKAYAIMAKSRLDSVSDIPTVDEAGLPGFYLSVWFGLWAPARTPKDAIATLNAAATDTLANQRIRARLAEIGQEIFPRNQQTPEALAAFQKAEIEKWWPIIKEAGIKA